MVVHVFLHPLLLFQLHLLRNFGRACIFFSQMKGSGDSSSFAPTSHALRLMETLAASARACEPVLLVRCLFLLEFFRILLTASALLQGMFLIVSCYGEMLLVVYL